MIAVLSVSQPIKKLNPDSTSNFSRVQKCEDEDVKPQ